MIKPLLAAALLALPAVANADAPVSIPGPDGGWDYASVDPATNRLFVAHGDSVGTVDLADPKAVTIFAAAHHAHALRPIPGTGELLVTSGDTATADLIDTKTGALRATVATGKKPDAAIWDAAAIVMNAASGTIMAIDPVAAKVMATITLRPGLSLPRSMSAACCTSTTRTTTTSPSSISPPRR